MKGTQTDIYVFGYAVLKTDRLFNALLFKIIQNEFFQDFTLEPYLHFLGVSINMLNAILILQS